MKLIVILFLLIINISLSYINIDIRDIDMNDDDITLTNIANFVGLNESRFLWGVAGAAFQTEGAINLDGRGPSIWDTFESLPGKIRGGDTAISADDSYRKFKEDIELVKKMGLNSYRFSISWSRILPSGEGLINQAGITHYNMVIDELISAGIEPMVTLYHWDLPQALQDKYTGWISENTADAFATYADICFSAFGDRVKIWTTLNEPWSFINLGYVAGVFAPGRCSDRSKCSGGDSATEGYKAAHNALIAHATAVDIYRKKYKKLHKGIIGIVLNQDWAEPFTDDESDVKAAERRREFSMGWFADPLVFGTYPPSMIEKVGDRLPSFTEEQVTLIKGSYDFIGLNHYSTKYIMDISTALKVISKDLKKSSYPGWEGDQEVFETKYDIDGELIGPQGASPWLQSVPWGFYKMLMWNHARYNVDGISPIYYITENGCDILGESTLPLPEVLDDKFRVDYYKGYLEAVDKAINDGVDIRGYYAWSLLDNFEWADGFTYRFGLYYVDYKDKELRRYPKQSSYFYAKYVSDHKEYGKAFKGINNWRKYIAGAFESIKGAAIFGLYGIV